MAEKMETAQENQNILHPGMFRKRVQETFLEVLGSHVCPNVCDRSAGDNVTLISTSLTKT